MALADCFKKLGKALSREDRTTIEALVESGLSETDAITQHLATLDAELDTVTNAVTDQGGTVATTPEPTALKQSGIDDTTQLSTLHNLTSENLLFADEIGGLAVPSIGVVTGEMGIEGYGDITLIGTKDLADPSRVEVFDADAYTATFPRAEYSKVKSKDAMVLVDEIRPFATKYGDNRIVDVTFDSAVNTPKPDDITNHWLNSNAAKAMYIKETTGKDVRVVTRDIPLGEEDISNHPAVVAYFKNLPSGWENKGSTDDTNVKIRQDAVTPVTEAVKAKYADKPTIVEMILDRMVSDGEIAFSRFEAMNRDQARLGKKQIHDAPIREKLDKQLKGKEAKFQTWVTDKVMDMFDEPHLKVGRKKEAYTLDNIVDQMTKAKTQGAEDTMTFGAGNARAMATTRFDSFDWMRNAAKGNLAPKSQLEEERDKTEKLLEKYRNAVLDYYDIKDWKGNVDTWSGLDDSMKALAQWAKKRLSGKGKQVLRQALSKNDFKGVPNSVLELGIEAGEAMLYAPVPYFEAKPQRAVGLDEFAGAVVPNDVSKDTLAVLDRHNIKYKKYGERYDEEARTKAVVALRKKLAKAGDTVLFQSGKDLPMDKASRMERAETMGFDTSTVWYHGTDAAGFKEFELPGKDRKTKGTGIFFTDDFNMARGYQSGRGETVDLHTGKDIFNNSSLVDGVEVIEQFGIVDDSGTIIESQYDSMNDLQSDIDSGEIELSEGESVQPLYTVIDNEGYEIVLEGTKEEAIKELDFMDIKQPGVYEVYLKNLKPEDFMEVDWGGKNWDESPPENWALIDSEGETVDWAYSEQEAIDRVKNDSNIESFEEGLGKTTDEYAVMAVDMDLKGIKYNNISDPGPNSYDDELGNVMVVFDPSNVRSVNAKFDPSEAESPLLLTQSTDADAAPEDRGSLSIMRNGDRIIQLGKLSDPSTFLHETAHLFLEMEKQFAAEFGVTDEQQVMLDWLGVESFDMIERDHHEKFAETFEVYLETGKSPSLALSDAFAAFRRWITAVYRNLRSDTRTRADLSPEIIEYFDRLLASEAEIEQASGNPAFDQFFRSQEQAGMTDKEWEIYQKQKRRAKSKAVSTLDEQLINELRHRKTQHWKEEKAPLIEEEKARLGQLPEYAILSDTKAYPMTHSVVAEANGGKIPGNMIGKTRNADSIDPAEYAEVYGYDSVEQMIKAIAATPPLNKASSDAAEQRMIDLHGDILNDGSIEAEAREAMHNDEQIKLLLIELKALGRKTKSGQTIDRHYLMAESKRMIEGMTYERLKPNKYYRAEIRAAKKAVEATNDKEAYEAKIQQVANHYLYRRSVLAKEDMDKQRRYVRRAQTRKYDIKQVEARYIANIKAVANLYDLRTNTERVQSAGAILDWYNTQVNDANQFIDLALLDINLIEALAAREAGMFTDDFQLPTFDSLTVSGMRGLYDQLRHLRFIGGQMSDEVAAEVAAKRLHLTESIVEHGGNDKRGTRGIPSKYEQFERKASHMVNKLPSLRNMMRKLDGFKGDEGIAYDLIYRDVEQANSTRINTQKEMYERFENELGDLHAIGLNRTDWKDYTLDSGTTLSTHPESRFMFALYWGTETSREAIRQGFGVTNADVMRIMRDLTADQLRMVNAVWKVNESLWPDLSSASVKQYGVAPTKLDPTPFTVNGVRMTGGHQRLYYDSTELELKSEQERGGSQSNVIPSKAGSLNSRVGSGGRPPLMDVHNVTRNMDESIHFIAFAETGSRLRSLVNATTVKEAIERKHGVGFYKAMIETIEGVTANRAAVETIPALAAMMRVLRRAATAKHLMYSVRNTLQQFSAIPIAMQEVGFAAWSNAAIRTTSLNGSRELKEFVNGRSAFMNNRASLVNREASEYLRKLTVDGKYAHAWQQFAHFGFTPQTIVDATIAYPTWLARYEQAMEEHGDDKKAASQADTSVAESVGSGSDLHLGGGFQSSNTEFARTFTLFGSWFNAYFQRVYKSTEGLSTVARKEAMYTLTVMPFLVAVMSQLLIADGPGEDEDWFSWAMKRYGAFMAGTVPLLRDMVGAFKGYAPSTVWSGGGEAPVRLVGEVESYIEGKQTGLKFTSDLTKLVGTIVPLPGSGNFTRVMDYMDGYGRGKEDHDKHWFLKGHQAITEGSDKN